MLRCVSRRALVAGAAAGACGVLLASDRSRVRCNANARTSQSSVLFREWAAEIEKDPSTIKELQRRVSARPIKKLLPDQGGEGEAAQPKPGKSLIWHTLAGEHVSCS